jgi:ubiquinone/menaquinone biosynthesis C-methylase UbiE
MQYALSSAMAEFDHWSKSYDRSLLQRWFFHPSHQLLLEQLRPEDRRILDVGCGTGLFALEVARRFPDSRVWGLDLSSEMLNHGARNRSGSGLRAVRGDSQRLPFADNRFDVVTCSHSFHHYPDQAAVVAEMCRVLRPGGRLLLIDGDRDRLWGWLVFDVIVTLAEGAVHHCSARHLRSLFHNAGFVSLEQYQQRGLLPFLLTVGHAHRPAAAAVVPARAAA